MSQQKLSYVYLTLRDGQWVEIRVLQPAPQVVARMKSAGRIGAITPELRAQIDRPDARLCYTTDRVLLRKLRGGVA